MGANVIVIFLAVFAFCASAVSEPAHAGGNPPEFDPERIEFATPTSQSSDCLGDLSTLICAAHTSVVCSILRERPDCKALPHINRFWNPDRHERLEYQILVAGTISRQRYAAYAREHAGEERYGGTYYDWVRSGVAQVRIRQRYCALSNADCAHTPWVEIQIVLEPRREGWRHVSGLIFFDEAWFVD